MALLSTPPRRMTHTLRAAAWLLRYPDAELRAALPALAAALRAEDALAASRLAELEALAERLQALPALRAEADYVELFDRGRQTSLHLFEHVHGDSRDRGPALIDLARTYEDAGLHLAAGELPDYLPAVLEYASTQPPAAARAFLGEIAHIVRAIFSALVQRGSGYASVLAAVLDLAGERADPVVLAEEPPLDETWQEPPAFGGCSSTGQSRPGQPQPIHIIRPASPGAPRSRAA